MKQRRETKRNMCAELVTIYWTDERGTIRGDAASLEDISETGACIHLDSQIPAWTEVSLEHPHGRYEGTVKHCTHQGFGYFVGIEFDNGYRWSRKDYQPAHFLELPAEVKPC